MRTRAGTMAVAALLILVGCVTAQAAEFNNPNYTYTKLWDSATAGYSYGRWPVYNSSSYGDILVWRANSNTIFKADVGVDMSLSNISIVTANGYMPSISPDGRYITYSSVSDTTSIAITGGNVTAQKMYRYDRSSDTTETVFDISTLNPANVELAVNGRVGNQAGWGMYASAGPDNNTLYICLRGNPTTGKFDLMKYDIVSNTLTNISKSQTVGEFQPQVFGTDASSVLMWTEGVDTNTPRNVTIYDTVTGTAETVVDGDPWAGDPAPQPFGYTNASWGKDMDTVVACYDTMESGGMAYGDMHLYVKDGSSWSYADDLTGDGWGTADGYCYSGTCLGDGSFFFGVINNGDGLNGIWYAQARPPLVVDAGWHAFVIRENATDGPPYMWGNNNYVPNAVEIAVFAGGQKAALGTDLINGATIGQISALHIDRLDDIPSSGSLYGPYFNIWVTDGLGNYAVVANEPSDGEWAGSRWDVPSWDFLKTKRCKVYETTGASGGQPESSWVGVHTGKTTDLVFEDVADLIIAPPPVSYIQEPTNGVGSGAPDELGTDIARGFNWIFGDTATNYVSGNGEGFVVANYSATADFPVRNLTQNTGFNQIQPAVDAANPGDTITVAPGIYEEQVVIDVADLNLIGSGSGDDPAEDSIIQSPVALSWYYPASANHYPIIGIDEVTGVTVQSFRIDGLGRGDSNYKFEGVGFWNAGGSLIGCDIVNIMDTPFSGRQHGVGLYAYNNTGGPYTVNITNVNVLDYQKTGMALNSEGLTANVVGCTTVGAGPTTTTAQNGIQFWGSEGGTISNCSVADNIYTGSGWSASGILLIEAGTMTINDTTIIDGDPAIFSQDTQTTIDGVVVQNLDPDSGQGIYARSEVELTKDLDHSMLAVEKDPQPYGEYISAGKGGLRGAQTVTITNSTVTGHCTSGYGISGSNYVAANTIMMNVSGCTVTDWAYGFVVFGSGGDVQITANNNAIFGNGAGFYSAIPGQDATNNWWGDATGPLDLGGTIPADNSSCADAGDIINETGLGDYVFDEVVQYCPWQTSYPRVTLEPDAECYMTGETVVVEIWMRDVAELIAGGQFFLSYENAIVDFDEVTTILPGGAPYSVEIYESVNEAEGTIDYAVGIPTPPGTDAVSGDALLATLQFTAMEDICDACDLITWRPHNPPSRLNKAMSMDGVYPTLVNMDVIDDESPTFHHADGEMDVTVECDESTDPSNTGIPTVTDNCQMAPVDPLVYADVEDLTGCNGTGTITRTWTATDACGNSEDYVQIITVADTIGPIVTGTPANVTVECDAIPAAPSTLAASDNCDASITEAAYDGETTSAGSCPDEYTITRTWTATDVCGNATTMTQIITVVDTTAPVFDEACPLPTITVPADAGGCEASVTYTLPTATDNCDPAPVVTCDWPSGSAFPGGTTLVTCTASDACGNTSDCTFDVVVEGTTEMAVEVELAGSIDPGPFTRCITFELWDCPDTTPAATVNEVMTFTNGLASATVSLPCGEYTCITARDQLHTLRQTDESFGIVGSQYVADFTGVDALVGGNLNDDEWIDILDFGGYIWQWAVNYGTADTTCLTAAPHADVNGDAIVDSLDFSFIQVGFLEGHEANCCGLKSANGYRNGPLTEILVSDLAKLGLARYRVADLDDDGVIDQMDIAAFMQGARPTPTPENVRPQRTTRIDRALVTPSSHSVQVRNKFE